MDARRASSVSRVPSTSVAGQADMGDARLVVALLAHQFEHAALEAAHCVVEQPTDIGMPPRRAGCPGFQWICFPNRPIEIARG